jgi:hypothetical protein
MEFHALPPTRKALRRIARAIVAGGLATLLAACPQPMVSHSGSTFPPLQVKVLPPGTPCPPGWTCKPIPPTHDVMAVSRDPIMLSGYARPVTINWVLEDSPGWTFTDNPKGIHVTPGQWDERPVGTSGRQYSATSTSRDGLPYKYHISVSRGSPPPLKWDPVIFND